VALNRFHEDDCVPQSQSRSGIAVRKQSSAPSPSFNGAGALNPYVGSTWLIRPA